MSKNQNAFCTTGVHGSVQNQGALLAFVVLHVRNLTFSMSSGEDSAQSENNNVHVCWDAALFGKRHFLNLLKRRSNAWIGRSGLLCCSLDQGWVYRIECRYIGLFCILVSISYRTSHMEYLDILKTSDFFVFFRRKFSENSENSPKIRRKLQKFAENSLKRRSFLRPKYGIVSRKKTHIVSNEKKHIAQGWSWSDFSDFRMHKYSVL